MLEVVSKIPERLCCKALTPDGKWEHWCMISTRSKNIMPETTCLSTGLADCTGAMIYEHDVVEFRGRRSEVVWNEDHLRYEIEFAKDPSDNVSRSYNTLHKSNCGELLIIGNKFEREGKGNV